MSENAVIIGAGPAGLTAAYTLLKETDIKPIVIEKEDYVGGISRTAEHNGNRIDIGGHRFFSKSKEVTDLWKELMPLQGAPSFDDKVLGRDVELSPGGPDPETEDEVFLQRNRVSRIFYLRKFFDYPISIKPQTVFNLGIWNTFKAGVGYIWSCIFKRKENNLEDFMINRFGRTLYGMFFKDYTEKVWGRAPADISADWGEQRIKGLSLMKALTSAVKKFLHIGGAVETSLIESFNYPKKGPGQLWELMRTRVEEMGGTVLMESDVIGFESENGVISAVNVRCGNEVRRIEADHFISSMPVPELIDALGPAVDDENVRTIAHELPFRDFITVGVLLNKLKIKNTSKIQTLSDIVPDTWIYVQEFDVKMGRIQVFNNWSPYMVADPQNTVWIGLEYFCNEGDEMWEMSDEQFTAMALDELVKIGVADRSDVLDTVRLKVKKAYPAYFGSYAQFDTVRSCLDDFENLYCIGRNGQHRYNNMDHSMLSAIEAVRTIKAGSHDKSAIWAVNTEQEYHEEESSAQ